MNFIPQNWHLPAYPVLYAAFVFACLVLAWSIYSFFFGLAMHGKALADTPLNSSEPMFHYKVKVAVWTGCASFAYIMGFIFY